MARLNDIGAPSESIEALKRRFVRQNREIARANSVQSLRIRTLEADVSRLLAENIALRERVITLDHEVEKSNTIPYLGDGVSEVKWKLAAKLEELGTLVSELGTLPQVMKKPPAFTAPTDAGEHTSLERPNPPRPPLFGANGYDDGRLPVILEDKYYPRRTLDSQEMQDALGDNFDESQSPDIGPPPIAHFDEFEPNSPIFEERFKLSDAFDDEICGSSELPPNLETRKKKRDVLSMSGEDWEADERPHLDLPDLPKAGSKRKLSVREDGEKNPHKFDEPDDFQYNLPAEKLIDDMRKVKVDHASRITAVKPKASALKAGEIAVRKPLGSKNTNTNTTSPKKQKQFESLEKELDSKKTAPKPSKPREQKASRKRDKAEPTAKTKPRQLKVQEETPLVMPEETCPETVDVQLPPKTPAVDDILSPNPAEPSGSKRKTKDTPPPSELTSLTPGTSGVIVEARPSRRPRAAVSYAEPSLRGKMRRSTKEFTDAVGEDRFRRSSQIERVDSEEPRSGEERTKIRTVTVKKEEPNSSSWKTLPTTKEEISANEKGSESPLGNKSGANSTELPSSVMTKRKRTTLSSNTFDMPEGPSSSSIAISTLVAGSKRPQHGKRLRDDANTDKCAATGSVNNDGPAPYDDLGASNNDPSNVPDDYIGSRAVRQSRRNSSKPKNLFQENSAPRKHTFTDAFDDDVDIRREEDDNFTYSKLEDKETNKGKAGSAVSKERRKAGRPKRDSSVDPLATSDPRQTEEQTTHGQRSASRRRSMMV